MLFHMERNDLRIEEDGVERKKKLKLNCTAGDIHIEIFYCLFNLS